MMEPSYPVETCSRHAIILDLCAGAQEVLVGGAAVGRGQKRFAFWDLDT